MKEGDGYHHLKEIIFLAITDFVMFPEKQGYRSNHVILDDGSHDHDLKDFSFCFLELPKFTKSIDELESNIDKWMYFFKHAPETTNEEMAKAIGKNEAIRSAYNVIDRFYWSEREINSYEHMKKTEMDNRAVMEAAMEDALDQKYHAGKVEGIAEGIEKGKAEGIAEAIEKGKVEMVKNMLKQNIDISIIASVTGLTEQEIEIAKIPS